MPLAATLAHTDAGGGYSFPLVCLGFTAELVGISLVFLGLLAKGWTDSTPEISKEHLQIPRWVEVTLLTSSIGIGTQLV